MGSSFPVMLPVLHGHHSPPLVSLRYQSDDSTPGPSSPSTSKPLVSYPLSEPSKASRKLFNEYERLSKSCKKLRKTNLVSRLKKQAEVYKSTIDVQNSKIVDMDKKIDQQNEVIQQQNAKIAEQAEKIA